MASTRIEPPCQPRPEANAVPGSIPGHRLAEVRSDDDGAGDVWLRARPSLDLPASSRFASLSAASDFFAAGSVGYSATRDETRLDGLRLHTRAWHVEPLDVDWVMSSYYADRARFPEGSVEYDCTLIMRDLPHEWQAVPTLCTSPAAKTSQSQSTDRALT